MIFQVFDDFIWNAYKKIKTNKNKPGISLKQHHDYKEKKKQKETLSSCHLNISFTLWPNVHTSIFLQVWRGNFIQSSVYGGNVTSSFKYLWWQLSTNYQSINKEENKEN